MPTREILTLQIGHYSNFVGAHWWNLQEAGFRYETQSDSENSTEINHDVLFREGRNLRGDVTFTPRLVSVDLNGSLKSLKQLGVLYDLPPLPSDLHKSSVNKVTVHQASPITKNVFLSDLDSEENARLQLEDGTMEQDGAAVARGVNEHQPQVGGLTVPRVFGPKFYNLDGSVSVWSDYLRIHLHPKTIALLPSYQHNSETESFNVFTSGAAAINEGDCLSDIEDRIHYFSEECDSLQGIHNIVDSFNGFGGVGSHILQSLQDDYSDKSILTFSVFPSFYQSMTTAMNTNRLVTTALSVEALSNFSSLLVPLSLSTQLYAPHNSATQFPHLKYKSDLDYHTSSILAVALDTASLPYRLKAPNLNLSHITDTFSTLSRKVASLSCCLPLPITNNTSLFDTLMGFEAQVPWQPLTPYVHHQLPPTHQFVVVRGIFSSGTPMGQSAAPPCTSNNQLLQHYLTETYPTTLNGGCLVGDTCCVKTPFPHIFSPRLDKHGYLSRQERPSSQGVEQVSAMTSLQSNNSIRQLLRHLHSRASRINVRKHHHFLSSTFEEDDFREAMARLESLAENYED